MAAPAAGLTHTHTHTHTHTLAVTLTCQHVDVQSHNNFVTPKRLLDA